MTKEFEGRPVTDVQYAVGGLGNVEGRGSVDVDLEDTLKFEGSAEVVKITYRSDKDSEEDGVIEIRHLNATTFRIKDRQPAPPKPVQEKLGAGKE